jgi:hypothetical protein
MDLSFRQNQTFVLNLNIAAWAPVYPLTACIFHMQMRTQYSDVNVIYSWSSSAADGWGNGTISYSPVTNLLTLFAPQSDMLAIAPGTYQYDLLLNYAGTFKDLTAGQIVFFGGITRS